MGTRQAIELAIQRYKKDLRQAEEELQQLHFGQQPRGQRDDDDYNDDKKTKPSKEDDRVWQFYVDIINSGAYDTSCPIRPWTALMQMLLPTHMQSLFLPGQNTVDEELIASLPHTHFEPVEGPEEESPFTGPTAILYKKCVLRRSCLLYTSPSPRDRQKSRMPSSA